MSDMLAFLCCVASSDHDIRKGKCWTRGEKRLTRGYTQVGNKKVGQEGGNFGQGGTYRRWEQDVQISSKRSTGARRLRASML